MAQPIPLCDDVLIDFMHFLKRREHTRANLASRRFNGWSKKVSERYPGRILSCSIHGFDSANLLSIEVEGRTVEFPETEPPEDILRFSSLRIVSFIGPEVLQFLRLSARLLNGCSLVFIDFDHFVRSHSTDFIRRFFALFPPNRSDSLQYVSASVLADHSAMFSKTALYIYVSHGFPLECLLNWLRLGGGRRLTIRFYGKSYELDAFVQLIKQDFLGASLVGPFTLNIVLYGCEVAFFGIFVSFNERNAGTGERLTFTRENNYEYKLERKADFAHCALQTPLPKAELEIAPGSSMGEVYKK